MQGEAGRQGGGGEGEGVTIDVGRGDGEADHGLVVAHLVGDRGHHRRVVHRGDGEGEGGVGDAAVAVVGGDGDLGRAVEVRRRGEGEVGTGHRGGHRGRVTGGGEGEAVAVGIQRGEHEGEAGVLRHPLIANPRAPAAGGRQRIGGGEVAGRGVLHGHRQTQRDPADGDREGGTALARGLKQPGVIHRDHARGVAAPRRRRVEGLKAVTEGGGDPEVHRRRVDPQGAGGWTVEIQRGNLGYAVGPTIALVQDHHTAVPVAGDREVEEAREVEGRKLRRRAFHLGGGVDQEAARTPHRDHQVETVHVTGLHLAVHRGHLAAGAAGHRHRVAQAGEVRGENLHLQGERPDPARQVDRRALYRAIGEGGGPLDREGDRRAAGGTARRGGGPITATATATATGGEHEREHEGKEAATEADHGETPGFNGWSGTEPARLDGRTVPAQRYDASAIPPGTTGERRSVFMRLEWQPESRRGAGPAPISI